MLGFKILHETTGFYGRKYNTWLQLNDCIIELRTPKLKNGIFKNEDSEMGIRHICFQVKDLWNMVEELKRKSFENIMGKERKPIYKVEDSELCKIIALEVSVIELRE